MTCRPVDPGRASHEAACSNVQGLPRSDTAADGGGVESARTRRRWARSAGQWRGPIVATVSSQDLPPDAADGSPATPRRCQ